MSRNASTSNRTMRNKFGSTSTNGLSQVPANQQLQTYIDHYGGKWIGKKRDFLNMPIHTYESLGSVGHIMVGKPPKLSTGKSCFLNLKAKFECFFMFKFHNNRICFCIDKIYFYINKICFMYIMFIVYSNLLTVFIKSVFCIN